jgi:hypothetical protein
MKKRVNPRNLKRGVFGVYTRKLSFFVVLAFIAGVGFLYFRYNSYKADTNFDVLLPQAETNPNVTIEIKDDGGIYVDGRSSGKHTNIVSGYDELRMPIIDKPVTYLNTVKVTLRVPKQSAYKTQHEILAIHGVDSSFSKVVNDSTILYEADGVSQFGTVSIVAQIPEGIVARPFYIQFFGDMTKVQFNYWVALAAALPLLTIIYLILFLSLQSRLNKVDMPTQAINYPPMAIPPAIVGALYHQKVGPREIAATLVDLARRRDIVILDRERGFAFGKGKFDSRLLAYEKVLLSKIFRHSMTSEQAEVEKRIGNHLYSKKISFVSAGIYNIATRLGYFRVNPQRVHAKYRLIGIFAFLLGAAGFFVSFVLPYLPKFTAIFWVGMMLSALMIIITAVRIPLRSQLGNESLSNWLAFRKFLADPNPIEYSNDLQATFEAYLPYAIVLDCEAAWARRFEPHNFIVPSWFLSDKGSLGLQDFCLSLFPIVSYVGRSFAALREPGFE